jgi:hypothetical protein
MYHSNSDASKVNVKCAVSHSLGSDVHCSNSTDTIAAVQVAVTTVTVVIVVV